MDKTPWFVITGLLLIVLTWRAIQLFLNKRKLTHPLDTYQPTYQQFISLLDANNAHLMWLTTQQGHILYANKALAELLNTPQEKVLGSASELPLSDAARTRLAVLLDSPIGEREEWLIQENGAPVCYLVKKHLLDDNTVACSAYLITSYKERENALIESELRMNEALKATSIGVWEWDVRNDKWFANPSYFSMLGYPPIEGLGNRQAEIEKVHPDDRPLVFDTIRALLEGKSQLNQYNYQARIRHANGEYRWIAVRCTVTEFDENDVPTRLLGIRIDIDALKKAQEQVEWLASHDSLTGLPNRSSLYKSFNTLIQCSELKKTGLALIFVDLDRFKNINDTMGHNIGDKLLMSVGERMTSLIKESGFVTRQGGDEFIILLPYVTEEQAKEKATEISQVLSHRYQIEQHQFVITPSIGISLFPRDGRDFDTLYKRADTAMYSAKKEGRNRLTFFTAEMQSHSERVLLLENALHDVIEKQELSLFFQPQMDLKTGQVIAAEVLLRWHSKELGTVSPAEFIPIAEDTGQILMIGEWVLRETINQLKNWQEQGITPVRLAVNLSPIQFQVQNLPEIIKHRLDEFQVPATLLEMELTERGAMADPQKAIEMMKAFQQIGVRTSIDDFGTGYSSLNYLQQFPIYKLKIDQSFIRDMTTDTNDYAIISAIISLAQQLGIKTIAEGVETQEQLTMLKELACDEMQGYYLSKPLPSTDFQNNFLAH
ncbi:EAL domain-containing protein [Marinomonas spartinae]|uniref:EAL domain-containing protein n=1 Tax=Marinomonas spartinae TaxID=1792290 RepID=UPI001A2F772E|nr:EAL domain-containing protein [Marinomonas spartinae]MBJ7555532.1 EAL domain-containing protein [Marinomonas spartinae]